MTEFATLQHATYTEAEWTAWDGVLLEGQMAFSSDVLYSGTDQMRHKVGNGTDTWTALDYVPEPTVFTGGNLTSALNEAKGADIASAATTDIGAATGNFVHVTGTTTITALGTVQAGTRRIVRFAGVLTLTHNATSLILPTGANITTAANDVATFVSEGSGNWRCVNYMRASGKSIFDTISQVITNGVTDKAPSEDAVYARFKQVTLFYQRTIDVTYTGFTGNAFLEEVEIPADYLGPNSEIEVSATFERNSGGTSTNTCYVGLSNTSGSFNTRGYIQMTTAQLQSGIFKRFVFKNGNDIKYQQISAQTHDFYTPTNNVRNTVTLDRTQPIYVSINGNLGTSTDSIIINEYRIMIYNRA